MSTEAGLIVGLGNPGPQYEATRHNYGFLVVDQLVDHLGEKNCSASRQGDDCEAKECFILRSKPKQIVVKPFTFMNLSGVVVGRLAKRHGIAPQNVIVLHDELDLPLGRMKIKRGGGTAGHNGLKSIVEHLGTEDFIRIRLGIDRPENKNISGYVLEAFSDADLRIVEEISKGVIKGLQLLFRRGFSESIHYFNSYSGMRE
jgi:PTH1 family peptidyl-tRNA hydrolase